jgi:hypothetical protein
VLLRGGGPKDLSDLADGGPYTGAVRADVGPWGWGAIVVSIRGGLDCGGGRGTGGIVKSPTR